MIKKSISVLLAVIMGIIPIENDKNASPNRNFTLSALNFGQSDSGDTEILPTLTPLKSQVDLYGNADSLPSSYDMRDYGKVTPVRDQTGFGTCWAHSAIASAESSIIDSKPEVNLSEFHTAYYTYSGGDQIMPVSDNINDIFNRGGTIYAVTNLWSQWIGPVFEKRLKYGDTGFFENSLDVDFMKYQSDYHLKNAYTFDFDSDRTNFDEINSLVKQFVYNGNAVDVSFYSDSSECYSREFYSTNSNKIPKFSNHSVAIVGWDDDFSADNFKVKPENDGAWLIKNSWGESSGDNGYMWISYEDKSLCEFAVYELENAEKYTELFYHDTFVALQSFSVADDAETNVPAYMANIFENDFDTQIEAVSTYINVPDTDYEITIYTNLTDESDPTSGTPSAVTKGSKSLTGYFTIPLDDYVILEPDTLFSVVVKLYSENSPYIIPIETSLSVIDDTTGEIIDMGSFTTYEGIKLATGINESFYSSNGTDWKDVYEEDYVYTEEEEEYLLEDLKEYLYEGIEPDDTEGLSNAALSVEIYRDILESGTTVMAMGNISLKAIGNPVGWGGFSHDSGVVPDGTKVELYSKKGEDIYYYMVDSFEDLFNSKPVKYTEPIEITDYSVIYIGDEVGEYAYNFRTYIPESKFAGYGDVNADGFVDAKDASKILENYSYASTSNGNNLINEFMQDYADINQDCVIDASDASEILALYAELSTK